MSEAGINVVRSIVMQGFGDLADGAAGITHIVDDQAILAPHLTDDVHHLGDVCPLATLINQRQTGIEPLRVSTGTLGPAGIRSDHDHVFDRIAAEVVHNDRSGIQVVNRNIKEPLDLRSVQINGQYTLGPCRRYQVRYQLGRDRDAGPVFLIRPCVAKIWDHGRYTLGRGPAKRIDHDQKLHQILIGRRARRLHDKNIGTANVLADLKIEFAVRKPFRARLSEIASDLAADLFRQRAISVS